MTHAPEATKRRRSAAPAGAEGNAEHVPTLGQAEPSLRILDARVMRGPSRWSRRPMVRLLVDLGTLEQFPSDRIPGFRERLLRILPGLVDHTCSYGRRGGFVRRLDEGTWAGHIAEHIALELQRMAGTHVTRGKTRGAGKPGCYDVLFAYRVESVGLGAGRAAVQIVNALVDPDAAAPEDTDVPTIVGRLRSLAERGGLGPSTQAIVDEAIRRDIPVIRLDEANLIQLGWGVNARRIRATITDKTGIIATEIAADKSDTERLLARAGLPVPDSRLVKTADEAAAAAERIGYPVVVKPLDGNHGRGVGIGLRTPDAVAAAFAVAYPESRRRLVLVQRQIHGRDHRFLVVGGRLVACAERVPAQVVGDGRSSVTQLVEELNRDPRRGPGHSRQLTRVRLDDAARKVLADQGLGFGDIPERGRVVALAWAGNLSTGGTSVDRTAEVHPDVARVAEMAARIVGLDVAGVDVMTTDVSRPLRETGGAIVEINAAPGFRMHTAPTVGRPRNVAAAVIDHLFPGGSSGRIPIAAVTGTNGKTTTVRMVAHILATSRKLVGLTTTDGIQVDGWTMKQGDMAGPGSARVLLGIPNVEVAVLEVARGGLLREGLGYDFNDVAIVTNVGGDHLGLDGVDTVEQLAAVKAVIVEAVPRRGTAVLNADDPLVAHMRHKCRGSIAWTTASMDASSRGRRTVDAHLAAGGLAGLAEGAEGTEHLVVRRGEETLLDMPVEALPSALHGAAWMNVSNALQAACAAISMGVGPEFVELGLRTFQTSIETAPGRLNVLNLDGREVILDYAHNPAGLRALAAVIERIRGTRRSVGVVSTPGDRRVEDQWAIGEIAGSMFDQLVVAEPNPRGRKRGETATVLMEAARTGDGTPPRVQEVTFVPEESDACVAAFEASKPGDLVVLCVAHAEAVHAALLAAHAANAGQPAG